MKTRPILGIDIGGSGIKGAPVDLTAGELATDRFKLLTPSKSTPKNVAKVVAEVVDHFTDQVDADAPPIGITVPAVVTHGVTRTAANIDPSGSTAKPKSCWPTSSAARSTCSTTPTRPESARPNSAPPRTSPAWSS